MIDKRLALALIAVAGLAGCGGDNATNGDAQEVVASERERANAALGAQRDVLAQVGESYELQEHSGVDNAFQLPNGRWCSIDQVLTGEEVGYASNLPKLTSPEGDVAVIVSYFLDLESDTPDAVLRADCAEAAQQSLGW